MSPLSGPGFCVPSVGDRGGSSVGGRGGCEDPIERRNEQVEAKNGETEEAKGKGEIEGPQAPCLRRRWGRINSVDDRNVSEERIRGGSEDVDRLR